MSKSEVRDVFFMAFELTDNYGFKQEAIHRLTVEALNDLYAEELAKREVMLSFEFTSTKPNWEKLDKLRKDLDNYLETRKIEITDIGGGMMVDSSERDIFVTCKNVEDVDQVAEVLPVIVEKYFPVIEN